MPAKAKLQIVEIEKEDLKPLGSVKECQAAILSLRAHLGFEELLRRMRLTRTMLRSRLETDTEADVAGLRALIQAYGFVERQLKQETGRPLPEEPRQAFEEEQQEYDRISKALQLIGGNRPV
jgi:hypothetical protein